MSLPLSVTPEVVAWLRCPRCRATMVRDGERFHCTANSHEWPIVLGIPDFRLTEDPLIPLADDYRKGEKLQGEAAGHTFAELVAYYWTLPTYPPTPADLCARFVHHVVTDDQRSAGYAESLGAGHAFADVGCGAGVLAREMAARFPVSVGVDVGFRWLVVARRGFEEAGRPVNLVCANAEHLPFVEGVFDTVSSVALLEHVPDADAVLAECARVTAPKGRVFVSTSNRFSLAPEPHVRVWGVGFLPRRWMPAYVKWRRGMAYEKKRLLSSRELRRGLTRAALSPVRLEAPVVTPVDLAMMGTAERLASVAWGVARRIPIVRSLLMPVFPVLQAVGFQPRPAAGGTAP
jgi:ubiquinone/menaquinone biosynthesis C-methylase UbiE